MKAILHMEGGKLLRELVATRVMGWELRYSESFDERPRDIWFDPETKNFRSAESWRPDEDESDSIAVMNRVIDSGLGGYILEGLLVTLGIYTHDFEEENGREWDEKIHSASINLVMCRLALLWSITQ